MAVRSKTSDTRRGPRGGDQVLPDTIADWNDAGRSLLPGGLSFLGAGVALLVATMGLTTAMG